VSVTLLLQVVAVAVLVKMEVMNVEAILYSAVAVVLVV
jgi:hypothetical protein